MTILKVWLAILIGLIRKDCPKTFNVRVYMAKGYVYHPYRDYWVPPTWDLSEPVWNADEYQVH